MAEQIRLVGDSLERVALDLARAIAQAEGNQKGAQTQDRTYALTLYKQCLAVVRGEDPPQKQ